MKRIRPDLPTLSLLATDAGVAVRGACHCAAGEFEAALGDRCDGELVLLGFTGSVQWPGFLASPEAHDGLADPLDRWSRRVIDALAARVGARAVYPGDRPALPFQRLARRCEPVTPSPLGLLIHPTFGLWHAYRGALWFAGCVAPAGETGPVDVSGPTPCERCTGRPCVTACPVGAFGADGFAVERCVAHLGTPAGAACLSEGCLARRACPVAPAARYATEQQRFHQAAFLRAMKPRSA